MRRRPGVRRAAGRAAALVGAGHDARRDACWLALVVAVPGPAALGVHRDRAGAAGRRCSSLRRRPGERRRRRAFRAGRARIEAAHLGAVAAAGRRGDPPGGRADADARAYLLLRPYLKRAVRVGSPTRPTRRRTGWSRAGTRASWPGRCRTARSQAIGTADPWVGSMASGVPGRPVARSRREHRAGSRRSDDGFELEGLDVHGTRRPPLGAHRRRPARRCSTGPGSWRPARSRPSNPADPDVSCRRGRRLGRSLSGARSRLARMLASAARPRDYYRRSTGHLPRETCEDVEV